MSNPESQDDRRSFSSRTPVNDNPEKVVYRRGFVTRHQVTGWRFVMRRIASGVALHDTRMLVDPLRTQTRAVLMGVIVLITGVGRLLRVLADPAERLGGQQSPSWLTGRRPRCTCGWAINYTRCSTWPRPG